jgi:hypothetical protein
MSPKRSASAGVTTAIDDKTEKPRRAPTRIIVHLSKFGPFSRTSHNMIRFVTSRPQRARSRITYAFVAVRPKSGKLRSRISARPPVSFRFAAQLRERSFSAMALRRKSSADASSRGQAARHQKLVTARPAGSVGAS